MASRSAGSQALLEKARRKPADSSFRRTLIYIPILHTRADMGILGDSLQRIKACQFGRRRCERSAELVERMWKDIEQGADHIPIAPGQVRVYQDGLPVCGHVARIVSDLAEAGSRNHQLLLRLEQRGAILMGTESPELLVEEYQLATEALHARDGGARRRQRLSAALLERRDRYIAARINATLQPGETGILFLGMLHRVAGFLEPDIRINYPIQIRWNGHAREDR